MKKFSILIAILTVVLILLFASCHSNDSPIPPEETGADTTEPTKVVKVDLGDYNIVGGDGSSIHEDFVKKCEGLAESMIQIIINMSSTAWTEETVATSALVLFNYDGTLLGTLFKLSTNNSSTGFMRVLISDKYEHEIDSPFYKDDQDPPINIDEMVDKKAYCFGEDNYYTKESDGSFKSLVTGEVITLQDAKDKVALLDEKMKEAHDAFQTSDAFVNE